MILDAEHVAFGDDGRPDFHLLRRKRAAVVAFVFDILRRPAIDFARPPAQRPERAWRLAEPSKRDYARLAQYRDALEYLSKLG